jgi:hypothetical protein
MAPLCDSCVSDFEARILHLQEATSPLVRKTGADASSKWKHHDNRDDECSTDVQPAAEQAVWLLTGIVTALLIIRFAFKLLAASTQASFVTFIYDLTQLFVAPFHGIFNTAANGHNVFEPESVVAIVIYLLIGWGLASLVRVVTRGSASGS